MSAHPCTIASPHTSAQPRRANYPQFPSFPHSLIPLAFPVFWCFPLLFPFPLFPFPFSLLHPPTPSSIIPHIHCCFTLSPRAFTLRSQIVLPQPGSCTSCPRSFDNTSVNQQLSFTHIPTSSPVASSLCTDRIVHLATTFIVNQCMSVLLCDQSTVNHQSCTIPHRDTGYRCWHFCPFPCRPSAPVSHSNRCILTLVVLPSGPSSSHCGINQLSQHSIN